MKKLRWGIVSTARICRRLLPPLQRATRSEVCGVASRDLAKATAFAREWGIPKTYSCYQDLLSDPEIDAVYIPLPNQLHCEWTVKACQAGKHVLCEKPLGVSVAEIDQMYEAARQRQVELIEAFQFRFHPQTSLIRDLIRSGRLGRPILLRGAFAFALTDTTNIRLKKEPGAGCLWDLGCYPLSFFQSVLEERPTEVFGWSVTGETGVDIVFAGQQRHPSGAIAQFECSFASPYRVGAEIVGEEGSLLLREAWRAGISGNSGITVLAADGSATHLEVPDVDPYLCEVEAMEKAALDGEEPILGYSHSRELTEIICAYHRSAVAGRPVVLQDGEGRCQNG